MRFSNHNRKLRFCARALTGIAWIAVLTCIVFMCTERHHVAIQPESHDQQASTQRNTSKITGLEEGPTDAPASPGREHEMVQFRVPRHLEIPRFPQAQLLTAHGEENAPQLISLCQYAAPIQYPNQSQRFAEYGFGGDFGAPIETGVGRQHHLAMNCPGDIPWQAFSYSQFVEPARRPFVPDYRVRVGDQILFIFHVTRFETAEPYRIGVGDVLAIDSDSHDELNKTDIQVLPDGTISISPLQTVQAAGKTFAELKQTLEIELMAAGIRDPRVTVLPVTVNLPNQDLRDAVDGRQGIGGQRLEVRVNWDGCVRLPIIDDVPVVGLTLAEVSTEINSRLNALVSGIQATPILSQAAPAFVYVLGEVTQQGQIQATRPMTALQAITQAGGFLPGANMRDVIVLRRTEDWRLIATRLNLWQAGYGKGLPYEDTWLHDGDIVIVPRTHIERLAELAELYFTRTIYRVIPNQGFTFAFTSASTVIN